MKRVCATFTFVIAALLQFSVLASAGPLDDYYLQQFGENKAVQLQKAILSATPVAQQSATCGMPLKHGLKRDWKLLESSTQKVLAKQLASPTLSGTTSGSEPTTLSPSGRFKIHYTLTGTDAVPSLAWVITVAQTFDDVSDAYLARGWHLAPTINGAPYDIYLRNLVNTSTGSYYGLVTAPPNANYATPSAGFPNAYASYMEIDKDFSNSIFTNPSNGGTFTPLESLQITAAHEYHHAIQYGYNYFFEIWFAEATATWYEDEIYDSVNQLYNYIHEYLIKTSSSIDAPYDGGSEYGRWIFNRYLSEQYGAPMIRGTWEKLAELSSPGSNADIPMLPVIGEVLSSPAYSSSLSTNFFGFTRRIYMKDWSSHTDDISKIPAYDLITGFSSAPLTVTLPHYSFAYYLIPHGTASLVVSLNKTSGIRASVFKKAASTGAITEVTTSTDGSSYSLSDLNSNTEVVLLIANTTDVDSHQVSFSTNGNTLNVQEPTGGTVYGVTNNKTSSPACFIATAAYGSYLHPQVQLLRNFRDEYLLGNAPGRALVALYYRYSPPLADFIAHHPMLRAVARLALTPLVAAVAHPLLAAFSLILLGAAVATRLQRRKSGTLIIAVQ